MKNPTTVERRSDRELVITRTFDGPLHIVYAAWTTPELFKRWWVPKSTGMTMLSCEMDIRTGGSYRLTFQHPAAPEPMTFFGKYIEVTPNARLVWTNEEAGHGEPVTTVTFAEQAGKTVVTVHELYPTKAAADEGLTGGSTTGMQETFGQLDALLPELGAAVTPR